MRLTRPLLRSGGTSSGSGPACPGEKSDGEEWKTRALPLRFLDLSERSGPRRIPASTEISVVLPQIQATSYYASAKQE